MRLQKRTLMCESKENSIRFSLIVNAAANEAAMKLIRSQVVCRGG